MPTTEKPQAPATSASAISMATEAELKAAVIAALKEVGSVKITVAAGKEVTDLVHKVYKECHADLEKRMVEVAESIRPIAKEITVRRPEGITVLTELTHCLFPKILALVDTAVPIYLHGAAGGGKTFLAFQIARALGLKYYPVFGGPTLTEAKLLGYRNASTGHYVKGLCYDPYVSGGLLFIDEADVGEGLIGLNALLANNVYRFPDGEVVERNPGFRVLAAGNTNWNGASGSYKRQAADGAFKDRFIRFPFTYDEKLELALTPAEFHPWARYVQEVRKYVATQTKDNRAIISPRAILKGIDAIRSEGLNVKEACEYIVLVDLGDDVRIQVQKEVKQPVLDFAKPAKPAKKKAATAEVS